MTFTANTNVIEDGRKNYVVRLQGSTDATDNEAAVTKVDISGLIGPEGKVGLPPSKFAVKCIEWNTTFPFVQLLFDATVDAEMATLTGEGKKHFDPPFNDPLNLGATGDIKLTTLGAAANNAYDITLHLIKK